MTTEADTKADRFDAFGLPTTPNDQNPLFADVTPEEIAAAPAEEIVPEAVVAEEIVPVTVETEEIVPEVAPAAATEEVADTGEESQTVEEMIFGKYKDMEAAQKGYDNLRDLQRRTAERARSFEQENAVVLARARELETTLQQAIPLIQALQSNQQPQVDQYGDPVQAPPVTPEMVDQMVRTRTEEARAQFNFERDEAEQAASREANVMGFYEKHPEVEVEGEIDGAIYDSIKALNEAWDRSDTEVNVGDPDTLEIVYEATKNPELLKVLQMRPEYIDTDEGMQLARFEAAIMRGDPITQQTRTVPASQVGQRALPVTESASTGGSAPAAEPQNEWTQAKQALAESSNKNSGSPFFE